MASTLGAARPPQYYVGTEVEVFISYSQTWVRGFEIAGVTHGGYTLRRRSDWAVLPGAFTGHDIRPTQHRRM
jgi:hypothetical protein